MYLFSNIKKLFASEANPKTPLGFCDGPGKTIEWKDCLACRCEAQSKYDLLLYDPDNKFYSAVCLGKVNTVQSLLREEKCSVNDRDENDRTALHFASCYGNEEIVNILVESNCEINALDSQKTTPLIKAVQMCEDFIVSLLLEHGADPNIKDVTGHTALHYAVYVGKPSIAAILLSYGADIEEKTEDGFSPLLLALKENQLLMAEFLIRRGADIHVSDDQQRTTLMYAVKLDSKRIVDLLLKLDIDVFFKDCFSWSALRYAVMGRRKVARVILDHQNSIINHIQRSNRVRCSEDFSLFRTLSESSSGITLFTPLRDRWHSFIKSWTGNTAMEQGSNDTPPSQETIMKKENPESGPEEDPEQKSMSLKSGIDRNKIKENPERSWTGNTAVEQGYNDTPPSQETITKKENPESGPEEGTGPLLKT